MGALDLFSAANGVICNFPDTARPELRKLAKALKRSDTVAVRGILKSYMLGSVWLENCSLAGVERGPGEPSLRPLHEAKSNDRPKKQPGHTIVRPGWVEAGEGNRTLVICLEGRSSTIELLPHAIKLYQP